MDAADSGSRRPTVRVHTKSIESVLSPISDQVAELMILDEKARQEGKGIPDLTQAAESVGSAIRNLVSVGRNAMEQGDDLLRSRMPVACEQIEAAGKLFMNAAIELKLDPLSSSSRSLLVQAARGLLDGTTNILMTFDAFEVRKIVVLGETLIELLASAKTLTSMEELVVLVKSFTERLVQFAQLVETRQRELINPAVRNRIVAANEALRKTSPLLVTSMQTFICNMDNDQAKAARNYAIEEALGAVHEIIMDVSNTDAETTQDQVDDYCKMFDDAVLRLLSTSAEMNVSQLEDDINKVLQRSEDIAATSTNARRREYIASAAGTLRKTFDAFVGTSEAERQSLASQVRVHMQALDQVIRTAIAEQVADAMITHDAHTPSASLVATTIQGTATDLEAAIDHFQDDTHKLISAATNTASISNDVRRVRIVQTTSKQVESFASQLATAARVVNAKPKDPSAQQHLALVKQTLEARSELLRATISSMVDPPRVVAVAGEATQTRLQTGEQHALEGHVEEVAGDVEAIEQQVRFMLSVAASEVENSEDPAFRDPIDETSQALQQLCPKVVGDLRALVQAPSDGMLRNAAKASSADLKRGIQALQYAVKGEPVPASDEADAPSPDLTQTIVEYQQAAVEKEELPFMEPEESEVESVPATPIQARGPSVFEQQDVPTGPIAVAALSLKQETDRWSERRNPIISIAKNMAERMADMARIANDEGSQLTPSHTSKGDMIGTAKVIAEEAKTIRAQALEIADNCSDKRLKADLLFLCDRLPTISTQLKIIASVKAASSHQSSEADAMLVNNAQNLMDTVQRTVRACEAASLKLFSSAASTAVTAIRWRRRVKAT
eukprot:m.99948 g.99948  ORF g.99948 m.99948 type:complete len:845 (-) comp14918_c0_seq4:93-2627(-)